jgi:hypothetical protein
MWGKKDCWREIVWRVFKKAKAELSYDPAIPLLVIHLKECEPRYNKGTVHPCVLQHYSQPRFATTDEWIKKFSYLYTVNTTQPQRRLNFFLFR